MNISFGKSAYVPGTPVNILDEMLNSPLSISAADEGVVIITQESLQEFIRSYEEDMAGYQNKSYKNLYDFIKESLIRIDEANDGTPIGDIFFTS